DHLAQVPQRAGGVPLQRVEQHVVEVVQHQIAHAMMLRQRGTTFNRPHRADRYRRRRPFRHVPARSPPAPSLNALSQLALSPLDLEERPMTTTRPTTPAGREPAPIPFRPHPARGVLLLLVASVCFGSSGVIGKPAMTAGLSPEQVAAARIG